MNSASQVDICSNMIKTTEGDEEMSKKYDRPHHV